MKANFTVKGNIVDIEAQAVYKGQVAVKDGKIQAVTKGELVTDMEAGPYIMPGFIESHIHIEDTLIAPYEFSRLVVGYGTVAAVCDPHEIGNVMGIPGINYMIEQSKASPLKFFYGAPSCVPATSFETTGAVLGPKEIRELMKRPDIYFLGEFMRFPEVIARNPMDMEKIQAAKDAGKLIDGHAPLITGSDLEKYVSAGITTEHECTVLAEAREKVKAGLKIIIREGSAAHNMETLYPLIDEEPLKVMLCTDDCHPDDLWYKGHMNHVIKTALGFGCKFFNVLRAATFNAVNHYKLPVGLLRVGDPADFIVVDSLKALNVQKTYINGDLVFDKPNTIFPPIKAPIVNNFGIDPITEGDVIVHAESDKIKVIGVIDKQLYTNKLISNVKLNGRKDVVSNPAEDILKIVVVNRYLKAKPTVGFIKGFGLKTGAIALSVSHDSHNITCVGVEDKDIVRALNLIIKAKGGVSAVSEKKELLLPLPIAGLMSDESAEWIGKRYEELQKLARELGCALTSPFPTLSFMALTVIPELKISDKGLFDVTLRKPVSIFNDK